MTEEMVAFLQQAAQLIFSAKANNQNMETIFLQHPIISPYQQQNGRWFKDSTTGQQTLRGFDINIDNRGQKESLRLLEQNPNKRDANGNLTQMANLASQGNQIMWIIDRVATINAFLGRIENGVFVSQNAQAAIPSLQNIPTIPASQNIPEYVASMGNTYEHEQGWEEEFMDAA